MDVPQGLWYTKDHEWIRVEGTRGTIGITDHAQHALGDITFLDVPKEGLRVKQRDVVATVESVKAASDIYAPLSGTVVQVNGLLAGHPETVNSAPYGEGWIAVIELSDPRETASLLDAAAYAAYLAEMPA